MFVICHCYIICAKGEKSEINTIATVVAANQNSLRNNLVTFIIYIVGEFPIRKSRYQQLLAFFVKNDAYRNIIVSRSFRWFWVVSQQRSLSIRERYRVHRSGS